MENQGQFDFDPEKFDFCIHRKKRNHAHRAKQEVTPELQKKIKTLLPKAKAVVTFENTLLTATTSGIDSSPIVSTPSTPAADNGKTLLRCTIFQYMSCIFITNLFTFC